MAEDRVSIDISDIPELLRIVEEAQLAQEPRVLTRNNEDVAVVVPMPSRSKEDPKQLLGRAAILATAGTWKGLVDADALKQQLKGARGSERKPPTL